MTTEPAVRLLLDTGVVVGLVRNDVVGQAVSAKFHLTPGREPPLISAVSLGEAMTLAAWNSWGVEKRNRLIDLLRRLPVVNIETGPVVDEYAFMANHTRRQATPIGQNDLWIAAAASATRSLLLTTDRDFDRLPTERPARPWIDPKTGSLP